MDAYVFTHAERNLTNNRLKLMNIVISLYLAVNRWGREEVVFFFFFGSGRHLPALARSCLGPGIEKCGDMGLGRRFDGWEPRREHRNDLVSGCYDSTEGQKIGPGH